MGIIKHFQDESGDEPDDRPLFGRNWLEDKNQMTFPESLSDCSQEVKKAVIKELESFVSAAEDYSPKVATMLRNRIAQLKK